MPSGRWVAETGTLRTALWADTPDGVDYLKFDVHLIRNGVVVMILITDWPNLAKALVNAGG